MQKNKSIKKILQTTAIIGTILPFNLLYLTNQTIYTEKDAAVFNLDNLDLAPRKLLPVGTVFTLADLPIDEQQKWCSSYEGPPLRFEVIEEFFSAQTAHGSVKILNNSSETKSIIENLQLQPFITGPDGLFYEIRKIADAAFSPNKQKGGNTVLRYNSPDIDTFRIPSGVKALSSFMFSDSNDQQQFPCSGKFVFSFYNGYFNGNYGDELFPQERQSLFSEDQFSEIFLTNAAPIDKYFSITKPLIQPASSPAKARLETVHINGFVTQDQPFPITVENSKDPFFSCSKIKNVYLTNFGTYTVNTPPSYVTKPTYFFDSWENMTKHQDAGWKSKFPNTKSEVISPKINGVVAELPPDINVVYNPAKPSEESLNFAAYVEGDYQTDSQANMSAKFYFNGEVNENSNFTFEKVTFSTSSSFDYIYSKNYHIIVQAGFDPDRNYFDGIYPCKMILSSTYDPMIKEEYMFNVEIKGNPRPSATSVNLNQKTIDIPFTEKRILTASVLPAEADQTLDWKSSNPAIVSVDSKGELTANGIGNATITATSHLTPSLSDTCAVTVKYSPPINITLSSETISTNVSTPQEITYLVNPSPSANQEISIRSDNEEIATATQQDNKITITPHSIGATEIWITSEAKPDVQKKCFVTVTSINPGMSSAVITGITIGTILGVTLIASGTTIYFKKSKKLFKK